MSLLTTASLLAALALGSPVGGPADCEPVDCGPADCGPADDVIEVSIDKLTSIEYRRGKQLPEDVAELDGKLIRIEGYMSIGTLEGVETFELVPEPCECGRSKLQHFIEVTLSEGTVSYRPGRITLEGRFAASEVVEDDFVVSLYRLTIRSLD